MSVNVLNVFPCREQRCNTIFHIKLSFAASINIIRICENKTLKTGRSGISNIRSTMHQ